MAELTGKHVAILVDDYFEEVELTEPLKALQDAGADVDIISTDSDDIRGMHHAELAALHHVDKSLDTAEMEDYDALVLPGGAINADSLRMNETARGWIKHCMRDKKPLAAICHAPWALASAGVTKGKHLTSFSTIQDDMRNAGADWSDEEVVIDGNLITSRKPDDIPAFNSALISLLQTA